MRENYFKIKDLNIFISDGNYSSKYPRSEEFVDNGIPFIRANNLVDGSVSNEDMYFITEEKHDILLKGHVKTGDVLITTRGNIGQVAIVPEYHDDSNINAQIVLLRPDNNILKNRYLLWSLQSFDAKKQYRSLETGTALKQLPVGKLKELYIKVPSLNKQEIISNKLDICSQIINKRKEELVLLDNLIKSRFVEMFGDPVHNPFDWSIKPFLECGSCKNGMNFGAGETGVELQYLGVGDFKDLTKIEEVTKLGHVSLNKMPSEDYMLKNGDIVFVRSNGNKALVGRCLAVYPNGIPTTYSGFCIRYRNTDESLEIPYLLQVLKTESMRLMMAGRGANIQNLNQQILGQLQIPIPPNDLQREFGQFIQQVDKLKVEVQKSLNEAQLLFESLMQRYFE